MLSSVEVERQAAYDGPTWIDQAIISKWRPDAQMRGFASDLQDAFAARGRWLEERKLAQVSPDGVIAAKPEMMRNLRQAETERLVRDLSRHLNSAYIHTEPGVRISGVYDRAITTPTGKIAVIRRQDTFTLAPWKPALEPFKGRAVTGLVGPTRVRGRSIVGEGCPADLGCLLLGASRPKAAATRPYRAASRAPEPRLPPSCGSVAARRGGSRPFG